MAFKIRMGKPSLRELLEIQEDNSRSLYTVPWGKIYHIGRTFVVKRAVPWKGVKGDAYKKVTDKKGENLYDKQQTAADVKRRAAAEKMGITYSRGMKDKAKGVAVVTYASGEIGIMPYWAALLGEVGKKGKIVRVEGPYATKEVALAHVPREKLIELEVY